MPGQYAFDFDEIFSQPGPLTVAYGMGTDSTALLVEMVRRGLPQALAKAQAQYGHLSDQQLTHARQHEGHAVTSKY